MAVKKTVTRRATRNTVGQSTVISTADWLITLIVISIPIVGLILALVWAFGGGGNYNKRNFCRATLILMAVGLVLGILFSVLFSALWIGTLSSLFGGW